MPGYKLFLKLIRAVILYILFIIIFLYSILSIIINTNFGNKLFIIYINNLLKTYNIKLNQAAVNVNWNKLQLNLTDIQGDILDCPILTNKNNNLTILIDNKAITIKINLLDISDIMKLTSAITRLKGQLIGDIKINYNRTITTNLALTKVTMSLPEYGIKIKPLAIYLAANNTKNIMINGKGIMRNGPGEFKLIGELEPFSKNLNNYLLLNSNNMEIVNTPEYYLIAALQLKLNYLLNNNTLAISGSINIPEGKINLDYQKTNNIVKSKDILILEQPNITTKSNKTKTLNVSPDLNLKIEPNTNLSGKGFNALISGKLRFYAQNSIFLGDGRITIKKGIYNLAGQEYVIEKGRLIYLPGTLINNPALDINVYPKNINNKDKTKYLYIEGFLNNPVIKDSGLANEHQAMLQLLNFGSNKIISSIKNKFKLQEFGIQEDHCLSSKFKYNPTAEESLLQNKYFIIDKKINRKLNIQYLKTLNSIDNTVRLKYNLSPYWSLDLESSSEWGHGADVSFFVEK